MSRRRLHSGKLIATRHSATASPSAARYRSFIQPDPEELVEPQSEALPQSGSRRARPHLVPSNLSLNALVGRSRLSPLFRDLGLNEWEQISSLASEKSFLAEEIIFCQGDPVDSVLAIAAGRVKIMQTSSGGKEVILRVDGPGDVADGLELCARKTHSVSAESIEPCRLLAWETDTFDCLLARFPVLQRNAVNILAERLRTLEERFREVATELVPQRLARMILRLLQKGPQGKDSVPIFLSCEELAQMVGTTLFTVSRLLCDWAERGIIQPERKAIVVDSLPALVAMAEGDEEVFSPEARSRLA